MNIRMLNPKPAAHRYRVTVEPRVEINGEGLELEETITEIEVNARTRWCAIDAAEKAGYTVKTCNLIGD